MLSRRIHRLQAPRPPTTRSFHAAATRGRYLLAAQHGTPSERDRLLLQHRVFVHGLGGLLFHPSLGDLSPFGTILDCAAGTGVWTEAVLDGGLEGQATRVGEGCRIEACDIAPEGFDGRTRARVGDVFGHDLLQPFPFSKRHRYDLINQRALTLGIQASSWPTVLRHLHDALRPGGTLHLHELEPGCSWPAGTKRVEGEALGMVDGVLCKGMFTERGRHIRLVSELPHLLDEAGYTSIRPLRLLCPMGAAALPLGRAFAAQTLAYLRHTLYSLLDSAVAARSPCVLSVGGRERWREVIEEGLGEVEERGTWVRMILVVARRPDKPGGGGKGCSCASEAVFVE